MLYRSSPKWLCGNSGAWVHDVWDILWASTLYTKTCWKSSIIYIYACSNLHIYIYTYIYIYNMYIYIYIWYIYDRENKKQFFIGMLLPVSCHCIHQAYYLFYIFCLPKINKSRNTKVCSTIRISKKLPHIENSQPICSDN